MKIKRIIIGLVIVILLVVIGVPVLAFMFIDRAAKAAIEAGGSFATGCATTVDSAKVGIMSGTFGMSGLKVANAPNFASPEFLSLGGADVSVSYGTLQQPVVELPWLTFRDLVINLDRDGAKSNYNTVLDHIKSVTPKGGAQPVPPGDEKRFIIKNLEIKNVDVRANWSVAPGLPAAKVHVPIESITLANIGSDGKGVTFKQLSSIIIEAVLKTTVDVGGGILPAEFSGDLSRALSQLGSLDQLGVKLTNQVGPELQKAQEQAKAQLDKVLKDANKQVDKVLDDVQKKAGDTLKNLLPGKK